MKKNLALALAVVLVFLAFGCSKASAPKAGSATGASMLGLLPASSNGVFLVDVHRVMTTKAATKALEDEESRKKYEEFVQESGIDPVKDLYYLAAGLEIRPDAERVEATIVLNLKYDREALLSKIREKVENVDEMTYEGFTIYGFSVPGEGDKPYGAFLDESNIVVGSDAGVKAVIDIIQKGADPVRKNEEMSAVIKGADTDALAWGAFVFSPELVEKMIKENAMLAPLEGVTGLLTAFDYKNERALIDFRTTGGNPDNNKNLADSLNGLKAMGALASGERPVIGELLGRIDITSGPDFVRIHADSPQEIMDKLQNTAKSMVKGKLEPEK